MSAPRYLLSLPKRQGEGIGRGELVQAPTPAIAAESRRAAIWCSAEAPLMRRARISVIGSLFDRRSFGRVSTLSARRASEILARPELLVRDYWGSYIALLSRSDGRFVVVRDPSGMLPCYVKETDDQYVLGSDLDVLEDAGLETRRLDWERLYEHLFETSTRRSDTCVEGVSELAPGAATWFIGGQRSDEFLWQPWQFTDASVRLAPDRAATELREVICASVSALASRHRRILVGVSGGLDSSIVCAALAAGGHDFACLTMATRDASGDERPYARQVAAATGADLLEHCYDLEKIDLARSAAAHLPRPALGRFGAPLPLLSRL